MNIGQIYETVLGWAGQKLNRKYATPIFDGATIDQINGLRMKQVFLDMVILICMMEVLVIVLINQRPLVLSTC